MALQDTSKTDLGFQTAGQHLWLDHIERLAISGRPFLNQVEDRSITGLSLTPHALLMTLSRGEVYDREISAKIEDGLCGETLAVDLIIEDACAAADLVRGIFDSSGGKDGWVALPASPLNLAEPEGLKKSTIALYARLSRPNILISIPGLPEYHELIKELVTAGIPINISLICSNDQFMTVAEAYVRAIEERIKKGRNPNVTVFISISVSQLSDALSEDMTRETAVAVSLAEAAKIYKAMRRLQASQRWRRTDKAGARFLRLIWVNSVDEPATDPVYDRADLFFAPHTVTSLSASSLGKLLNGQYSLVAISTNSNDTGERHTGVEKNKVNVESLSVSLQKELVERQVKTWIMMLDMLAHRSAALVRIKHNY